MVLKFPCTVLIKNTEFAFKLKMKLKITDYTSANSIYYECKGQNWNENATRNLEYAHYALANVSIHHLQCRKFIHHEK